MAEPVHGPIIPIAPAKPDPLPLCASTELAEKGNAFVFDVLHYREPARAFALRFDGQVVAYLNRCLHVPTEMDWQYGEFLDSGKEFIMCSIHGAVYEPLTGRCAGGPCGRGRLTVIEAFEREGQVYWVPSRDTHLLLTFPRLLRVSDSRMWRESAFHTASRNERFRIFRRTTLDRSLEALSRTRICAGCRLKSFSFTPWVVAKV